MIYYAIGKDDESSFAFIDHKIKDNKATIKDIEETKLEFASRFNDPEIPKAILTILKNHIEKFEDQAYILSLRVFRIEIRIREI